ncbi:hypothetical protein Stsp02_49690 [Streptomyces sp. NBRC 14336]|uniref:LppU/SCO3897 family protein n=1 Tax=Streptomyces sp. NBRC 14336 TaxID=3030992 RepID=UPI0024A54A1D|nr:hypothetical protein [Streptomyces sp. NBRC 14336]WBO79102.1 hypothetical protein SBE_002778 [Streptomyces sp. SBE_14.2]GLW49308.1 hypothetical protein Stsp02_49690 [Streptomyces sp. NBRC 14336]
MSTPPQGQNPFAQGQNPYGQQPGQLPVPQQGAAPYAPVPPTPPARRVSKKVLRIVAFIVVAILIAVGKWYLGKTDAESASVGSCMKNEGTQFSPDLKTVDCSSSEAKYEVVEKFDNTSDDSKCEAVASAEIAYYQTGDGHDVVLCLKEVK